MNIMNMKVTLAMRAVDKAKRRSNLEKERRAGAILRRHIEEATPWEVYLRGPRRSIRNFIKFLFTVWAVSALAVVMVMVVSRVLHNYTPTTGSSPWKSTHTVEIPL